MADTDIGEVMTDGRQHADKPAAVNVMSHTWLVAVFGLLYAAVFVLGLAGNLTVIYVVATRRRVRASCRNVLIGNLAAADVLLCLLAVPFTPLSGLLRTWPFGDAMCHAMPMALGVSVYVSTLTVLAIAVDRYFVIVKQFQLHMTTSACLLIIIIIWVTSVAVSTPLAVHQKVFTRYPPYVIVEGYIWLLFFSLSVTDISATVAPIGVKFCVMVHIGPGHIFFPFGGGIPGILKSEFLGLSFGHI